MPIQIACPRCKHVMRLPDNAGGRIGRCKLCGGIVRVPLADSQRKFCCICHADVSQTKRIKDVEGKYYCPACWDARKDAEGATGDDFWDTLEDLDKK